MKGIINSNIYVENKGIVKTSLLIENGIIKEINDNLKCDNNFIELNKDEILLPGFIDEHIHGAAGFDAMDGTTLAIESISKALTKEGTTGFLATTMTQSESNINRALKNIADYKKLNSIGGAKVLGIHLEGPFISSEFVGAQPKEYLAELNVETFKKYLKISENNIKIVSFAPELENSKEFLSFLKSNNIVASIGHSNAKYAQIEQALQNGLQSVTHTFNAQRPLHHREIGVVGSALLFDELYAEMICDRIHLSVPAIKLIIKNKPHNKVVLITDAMRAKQMPEGESELGGQIVIVKNSEARLKDGTLAGSVLKMNEAIKNVTLYAGENLTSAVDYATINPATNLGLEKEIGSIKVGKYANFTVLDREFNVKYTIIEGEIVYKA